MLEKSAPILPCRDFDETSAFYRSLGFEETGRWSGEAGYMIMACGGVELHFKRASLAKHTMSHGGAYIMADVDAFSAQTEKLGLPRNGQPSFCPAQDMDWGMREASVIDPNGNLLRIGQFA